MHPASLLGLPSSLLLLIANHVYAAEHPTAIRKMAPNAAEKLLPDDLAFADDIFTTPLSPREELLAARMADDSFLYNASFPYRPPFAQHSDGVSQGWEHLRRAAEALHILESRQACPANMNSCENIGSPNKCCMSNEVCVKVEDEAVGNVACCPNGATCSGTVGACPNGTTSCDADLSGGCCIPGYVCQGVGCVPSPLATSTSPTGTATGGGGSGSTTVRETTTHSSTTTNQRTTSTTPTTTATITGAVPPFRPTSTNSGDDNGSSPITSSYCPTGFYACLARAGGGCCQTGRDCATTSCPPTPSTTIITNGATVVVPVSDVPESSAAETCAGGWFLCGEEGGPVPGCCPSGYECGTASCTSISPTQTGEIQKHFPNAGSRATASLAVVAVTLLFALV
ncbi:hypothetical protein EsH8_V_000513 [Colletotrichum jinshuiense]